jgi:two-component system phosphate regulon response regulator PhoB
MASPLVLLVEDHEDTRELYSEYLREVGGLSVLDNVASDDVLVIALQARPSVIVTDYRMSPVDGLELCRQLRAHPETSHIPLIMLTAHAVAAHVKVFRETCNAVLLKPCSPDKLLSEIRRFVAA